MGNSASSWPCSTKSCFHNGVPTETIDDENGVRPVLSDFMRAMPVQGAGCSLPAPPPDVQMQDQPGSEKSRQSACCVVYIERIGHRGGPGAASAAVSTVSGFSGSGGSQNSSKARTKAAGMSMRQTMGVRKSVPPEKLDEAKVASFKESLRRAGIDTSSWGYRGAKSVEHLYWETYHQRGCIIIGLNDANKIKRVTRLLKIRLVAEIFGMDHVLYSRMQFMHDGQTVERKQVPLKKLKWENVDDAKLAEAPAAIYAEDSPFTEPWRGGCKKTLEERLGMNSTWQALHLIEEPEMYKYSTEDNLKSDGYPGLNTLYCIHEVTFRVRDPAHAGVQIIGLPEGQEFATAEGDFNFGQHDQDGLSIGTQLNIWTWMRDSMVVLTRSTSAVTPGKIASDVVKRLDGKDQQAVLARSESPALRIRRVPLPDRSARVLREMQARLCKRGGAERAPSNALWSCLDGTRTDWTTVRRMASRIADPTYTLRQFNSDLAAFPELNLYLLEEKPKIGDARPSTGMSSGRTIGDEYQRTIGAFFAIYWMMRIDIDGQDGFACGVDENWQPITGVVDKEDLRVTQPEKRTAFQKNAKWDFFKKLLLDAGLFDEKVTKGVFKTTSKLVVNEKRLVSLLALTAIHDIMKMRVILPEVQIQHAPYHGYASADTIGDHDHALSYVMEHYPTALPSFRDLDEVEKRSVQFTQCNLCFNHGWFVQAEAPPGAIFTKFREALIRDHKSLITKQDVALYFVHWLTDLAGAEPTPLAGCEKFVTKFPLPVLNSFLRSFEFVGKIASNTETEVMEEYLKMRWQEAEPAVGPLPTGDSAIARMRLLCMAQANTVSILKAFDKLAAEDTEVLSVEMSRTGVMGQSYSAALAPSEATEKLMGPAFLVYYGPAFLQNLGNDSPGKRLVILAEIYRCARALWPASVAKAGASVTIRVDVIKTLSSAAIVEASLGHDCWMLVKHNETEAFVERSSKKKLNKMIASGQQFQVLDLSRVPAVL